MNLKRYVVDQLVAYLKAQLASSLLGSTLTILADRAELEDLAQEATTPVLRAIPGKFRFEATTESDEFTVDATSQVVDVGAFLGPIELRLMAKTPSEREELEQLLLDAFFQTEGHPALVMVLAPNMTVGGKATLYPMPIAYELRDEEWDEEKIFSKKLQSVLSIDTTYKAVALRTAYDITEVISALDASTGEETDLLDIPALDPLNPTSPSTGLPQLEELEIQSDGTTDLPV